VAQIQAGVCVGVEYGFCSFLVDGFLVSKQKINGNGPREIFCSGEKTPKRRRSLWRAGFLNGSSSYSWMFHAVT
jgi:hypothetical protein